MESDPNRSYAPHITSCKPQIKNDPQKLLQVAVLSWRSRHLAGAMRELQAKEVGMSLRVNVFLLLLLVGVLCGSREERGIG